MHRAGVLVRLAIGPIPPRFGFTLPGLARGLASAGDGAVAGDAIEISHTGLLRVTG